MSAPDFPRARIQPAQRSWAWILPAAAAALAIFLAVQALGSGGTRILVRARVGHGIEAGDSLRYRGIRAGSVEEVRLARDLGDVELAVRLDPGSEDLARAGSRFWIVRPHLSLDSVQGLETVVGARYLAVIPGPPGPPGGRRQTEFVALEEPPVPELVEPEGLEITLEAPSRFSLAPGAPLTYREIQVGTLLSVGLSSDATAVEMRAYVRPPYTQLVRENTRLWETGGIEVGLSLTGGFRLDMGTVRSMLVGAIALATPPDAGPAVSTGHRFVLHAEPEEAWLGWSPPLVVGGGALPGDVQPPRLLRAKLRWRKGRYITRQRERQGWVVPLEGELLGPADLLRPGESAVAGSAELEVGGAVHPLDAPTWEGGGLARAAVAVAGAEPYATSRARALGTEVEDCLVYSDPALPPMALAANRLRVVDGAWEVDAAIGLEESWHGACVLARADGALVGVLLLEDGAARVVDSSLAQ